MVFVTHADVCVCDVFMVFVTHADVCVCVTCLWCCDARRGREAEQRLRVGRAEPLEPRVERRDEAREADLGVPFGGRTDQRGTGGRPRHGRRPLRHHDGDKCGT